MPPRASISCGALGHVQPRADGGDPVVDDEHVGVRSSTVAASSIVRTVPPRSTSGRPASGVGSGMGHRLLLDVAVSSRTAVRIAVRPCDGGHLGGARRRLSRASRPPGPSGRTAVDSAPRRAGETAADRRGRLSAASGRAARGTGAMSDGTTRKRAPAGGGPLAGLLVADFSRILAGPYATMLLADLGAEVVKVEGPGGDDTRTWQPPVREGVSTYYLGANRNKRSIALDLKDPGDVELARELARRADVFVGELQARRAGPLRPRLRQRGGRQPRDRLRVDQRLRQRPGGPLAAGLRPHRAGHLGLHEPHRRPRRRALPRRRRALRRDGRAARDHRRPRGAEPPPRDRSGPAHRGEPAVLGPVRSGEPDQRLRRRRGRALPDGQQPSEPLPLRAPAVRRRRADRHRRQRRAVPPAVRGARAAGARPRTPGSCATRTAPPTATSSARSWSSGCGPGPSWTGSATSSVRASPAGRSTRSTRASPSRRRWDWIPW